MKPQELAAEARRLAEGTPNGLLIQLADCLDSLVKETEILKSPKETQFSCCDCGGVLFKLEAVKELEDLRLDLDRHKKALALCKEHRDDAIWNRFKLKPQFEKVFFADKLANLMDAEIDAILSGE